MLEPWEWIAALSDLESKYPFSQLLLVHLDVTQTFAIKFAFNAAVKAFGKVDVVFNNAGAFQGGEVEGIPEADVRKLFDVNLWGAVNGGGDLRSILPFHIEPGGYVTGWEKGMQVFPHHPAYNFPHMHTVVGRAMFTDFKGWDGDAEKAVQVLYFKLARAENPLKLLRWAKMRSS
ncbi:hypothetical protein B0H17DRAFT_1203806 [Mycena rosella]|uniref:NAD(P)-binding protein n=1 Tax=Mycena rosella TaxID=1033263 RepID=A0AAD7DB86_MYCRO|nr:hypothetical protein B0H17DRAFT_1203806 [Mycena rosella]